MSGIHLSYTDVFDMSSKVAYLWRNRHTGRL